MQGTHAPLLVRNPWLRQEESQTPLEFRQAWQDTPELKKPNPEQVCWQMEDWLGAQGTHIPFVSWKFFRQDRAIVPLEQVVVVV